MRIGTAQRVGPGHQLAVDPHEEPVVEVDQQSSTLNRLTLRTSNVVADKQWSSGGACPPGPCRPPRRRRTARHRLTKALSSKSAAANRGRLRALEVAPVQPRLSSTSAWPSAWPSRATDISRKAVPHLPTAGHDPCGQVGHVLVAQGVNEARGHAEFFASSRLRMSAARTTTCSPVGR